MEKEREERESGSFHVLDKMEEAAKGDSELEEALEDVKESIVRYNNRVHAQERKAKSSGERIGAKEAEESDRLRRAAHDALIDRINILSRLSAEKGMEPEWRKSWGSIGSQAEREHITEWVGQVAPVLEQEKKEAEEQKQEQETTN